MDTWGIGLGERLDVPPRRGIDLSCRQGLVKRTPSQDQYLQCCAASGGIQRRRQPPGSSARHPFWCAHAGAAARDRSTTASALSQSVPRPRCLRRPGRQRLRRRAAPRRDACPRASGGMCTLHHLLACCRLRLPDVQDRNAICIGRIIGDADLLDLVPLIPEIVADVPMSQPCPAIADNRDADRARGCASTACRGASICCVFLWFPGWRREHVVPPVLPFLAMSNTCPKYSSRPLMYKH